jgi:hypothetical protein
MMEHCVAERTADSSTRGRLRALYEWLTGASAPGLSSARTATAREALPDRIGHYTITHKLGEGGMGVVYAARDERLERTVALKRMSSLTGGEAARRRFWREARAAASVNHPNICQIYEIGEDNGELFIAMELLEGEVLAARLQRGALNAAQAVPIGLGMLAALSALHQRGIVHQRSGALCRTRARLPLLRALRTFDRRARGGAPTRSERADEPRRDAAARPRHRTPRRARAAVRHRGRR